MQTQSSQADVTATGKLNVRMAANEQAGRDFDEWCFRQLPELPLPARVLDLGCGTGKQLLLFSRIFSPTSVFAGIDLSAESLAQLRAAYQSPPRLQLIEGSFDQMEAYPELEAGSFDLIYGSYALYYSQDVPALVRSVYRLLKPGGVFWAICPYMGTNDEFLRILRPLHEVEPFMDYVFERHHGELVAEGERAGFRSLKPALLRNKVYFPTAEDFLRYLSHSLFYRPGRDEAILAAIQQVIDAEGTFRVSKNVISVQLRK
ncbi:MAG: hypothetical protein OHK0039_19140 [Bacteroidia bacterium]